MIMLIIDNILILLHGKYNLFKTNKDNVFLDTDNNNIYVVNRDFDSGNCNNNVIYIENTLSDIRLNNNKQDYNLSFPEMNSSIYHNENILNRLHFAKKGDDNSLFLEGFSYIIDMSKNDLLKIVKQIDSYYYEDLKHEHPDKIRGFIIKKKLKYEAMLSLLRLV